jgi:VIT1/CCC1 family predicted Fe2+/Mn2+ transporter
MALGEYVSVSSQRDSEAAQLAQEQRELAEDPNAELAELVELYRGKGLSESTAHQVAAELTEHDALAAHLSAELNLDPDDFVNPVQAASASALSFTLGAILPMLAILLPPPGWPGPAVPLAAPAGAAPVMVIQDGRAAAGLVTRTPNLLAASRSCGQDTAGLSTTPRN